MLFITGLHRQWSDGQGVVVPPPAIPDFHPGIGGRPAKHRQKRLIVEIDGKEYVVASQQEAVTILRKAKETVKREIRQEVRQVQAKPAKVPDLPEPPKIQVIGESPLRAVVEQQVGRFERDMNSIFVQANLRVQEVLAEQDDEDVLMLL